MPVVFDHSPMHVLVARRGLPFVFLGLLVASTWWAVEQAAPSGLSAQGWRAIIVFGLCLILWISQLLPLAVTAILGLALLPLLGVLPATETFALFGNPAVFFILGAFMLAAGVIKSGLSEHLALSLLDRMGTSPRRLLLAMLLLPAFMAFFMPEHAVAAVFLPLAWEVVRALGLKPGDRYAQSLFLAMAWGAIIGGVATLLGGARGPLAMALLQELTGRSFSFLDWSIAAAPLVISMLAIGALVLLSVTPVQGLDVAVVRKRIEEKRLQLGLLNWRGRVMALLMAVTIIAWLSAGHTVGLASIALISVVCMFALRLVSWQEIQVHVSWDVILLYGGAIAIGKAVAVTGAGTWLVSWLLPGSAQGLLLLLFLALATLLLTEGVSNAAAVAIMLPVAIPVGLEAGMDPVMVSLAVGIVAGFAFMLPMGTPPNAMVLATGYVKTSGMLRYGAIMSISALTLFAISVWLWWPLVGIGAIE